MVVVVVVVVVVVYLPVCLSVCLSAICKLESEAILRDSSTFELDNVKKDAILRDFFNF